MGTGPNFSSFVGATSQPFPPNRIPSLRFCLCSVLPILPNLLTCTGRCSLLGPGRLFHNVGAYSSPACGWRGVTILMLQDAANLLRAAGKFQRIPTLISRHTK